MSNVQAISLLLKIVQSGRIPHAFLFTGYDAKCKYKIVFEFAKWLLHDKNAHEFSAFLEQGCTCASCHAVSELRHPDFFYVDDTVPSIQKIRGLRSSFSFSPFQASRRVAVVAHADTMKKESANALLKLLEEPKGAAFFFLIARSRSQVIPTLSSRTVEIRCEDLGEREAYAADLLARYKRTLELLETSAVYEKFQTVRSYTPRNKDGLMELLDAWLLKLRKDLLASNTQKTYTLLKQIFTTKQLLMRGNSNPQLLLEKLLISN